MSVTTPYEKMDEVRETIAATPLADLTDAAALARLYNAQTQEVYDNARQVVSSVESLMNTLRLVKERVEADPLTASINPLGEVQAQGGFVDAAVAELHASRHALKRIEVALGLREPGFFS